MEDDFHAYGVFLHFILLFDFFLLFFKLFLFFLRLFLLFFKLFLFFFKREIVDGIVGGISSTISFSFSRTGESLYDDENKFTDWPGEGSRWVRCLFDIGVNAVLRPFLTPGVLDGLY